MEVGAPHPAHDAINEPLAGTRDLLDGGFGSTAKGGAIRWRKRTGKAADQGVRIDVIRDRHGPQTSGVRCWAVDSIDDLASWVRQRPAVVPPTLRDVSTSKTRQTQVNDERGRKTAPSALQLHAEKRFALWPEEEASSRLTKNDQVPQSPGVENGA